MKRQKRQDTILTLLMEHEDSDYEDGVLLSHSEPSTSTKKQKSDEAEADAPKKEQNSDEADAPKKKSDEVAPKNEEKSKTPLLPPPQMKWDHYEQRWYDATPTDAHVRAAAKSDRGEPLTDEDLFDLIQ